MKFILKCRARPVPIIALVLVIIIGLAGLFRGSFFKEYPAEKLLYKNDQVEITGRVVKEEIKNHKTILTLENSYILIGSTEHELGKTLATLPDETFIEIGAQVTGTGTVALFSHATNPGQFDEYSYYKSLGINARFDLLVNDVNSSKASSMGTFLARLRMKLGDAIDNSFLSNEEKSILSAMVLGDKTEISEDTRELYRNAGIIHLISISGLHISLVGAGLFKLLRKRGVNYPLSTFLSSLVMIGFVVMTGASVSSIRALICFLLTMGAELLGRTTDPLTSISLAGIVLLVSNPAVITNSGFLLSFGAVLGIAFWGREFGTLMVSAGLFLFTLPILLYFYYEFPLYSILINLVVIPMAPFLLLGGILGSSVGLVSVSLSNILFLPTKLIFLVNDGLTHLAKILPNSSIILGQPSVSGIVIYYGCLVVLRIIIGQIRESVVKEEKEEGEGKKTWIQWMIDRIKKLDIRKMDFTGQKKKLLLCGMLMAVMFISISFHPRTSDILNILDVGQGDCILIQCKNGGNVLIDGGSSSVPKVGEKRIVPALKCLGISKIDKLILTHADNDHISGVQAILDSNVKVGEVLVAKIQLKDNVFGKLLNNVSIQGVRTGDSFKEGDVQFKILAPDMESNLTDNAASVVVEMNTGSVTALFTGDVEGNGEKALINSGLLHQIDILKVAHHGSKNSTSEEFLRLTNPKLALISAGRNNSYGHPHKETIDRLNEIGCETKVTIDQGAIRIKLDMHSLL